MKAGNGSEIASEAKYVITPTAYVDAPTTYAYAAWLIHSSSPVLPMFDLSIYAKDEINITETV